MVGFVLLLGYAMTTMHHGYPTVAGWIAAGLAAAWTVAVFSP
jgi:hypothetical protein